MIMLTQKPMSNQLLLLHMIPGNRKYRTQQKLKLTGKRKAAKVQKPVQQVSTVYKVQCTK